jgi:CspA family cold shock protein
MVEGKVKWFSIDKGFGFIEPEDGSDDVFVHSNSISNPRFDEGLREGDKVEFETERTPKGLSAENVTLLDDTLA